MKLSTKAWIMGMVVFVGTMPHSVANAFMPTQMVKIAKPCHAPISYMKVSAKRLGKTKVMQMYGSKKEWKALLTLWTKESRWDYTAKNPKSSAFGIPQILRMPHNTPMVRQIDLGLKYIESRYGTPTRALAFHNRNGWY